MSKYATGKYARAISDRSGMEFPYREMVREWNGAFVHVSEYEPKQPQLEPKPQGADGIALLNVRSDRTEPATTVRLPNNAFETYQAGSAIINVFAPGHGLTDNTTYRFRGAPTTSPGTGTSTNPVFAYAAIPNFDGIYISEPLGLNNVPIPFVINLRGERFPKNSNNLAMPWFVSCSSSSGSLATPKEVSIPSVGGKEISLSDPLTKPC